VFVLISFRTDEGNNISTFYHLFYAVNCIKSIYDPNKLSVIKQYFSNKLTLKLSSIELRGKNYTAV